MTDRGLPRRPMTPMHPPVDGLDEVRREAGRRRRRRAVLSAAGGATVAAAAAVALVLTSQGSGFATLTPVPPAHHLSPAPTVNVHPPRQRLSPHAHEPGGSRGTDGSAPVAAAHRKPAGTDSGLSLASPSQARADSARTTSAPMLTRRQTRYDGDPRLCSGSEQGDGSGLSSSVGWCLTALTQRTSNGVRLTVDLCRDSTGPGTLTFAGSREVDLAVVRNGKVVWNWAHAHPGRADRHQLSSPANGCWDWSLVWSGQTNDSTAAPRGGLTFVATSTSDDMQGKPSESTTFQY